MPLLMQDSNLKNELSKHGPFVKTADLTFSETSKPQKLCFAFSGILPEENLRSRIFYVTSFDEKKPFFIGREYRLENIKSQTLKIRSHLLCPVGSNTSNLSNLFRKRFILFSRTF